MTRYALTWPIACVLALAVASPPARAYATWGRSVVISPRMQVGFQSDEVAFAPDGRVAVTMDVVIPGSVGKTYFATRSLGGSFGHAQRLKGISTALSLAFVGSTLDFLTDAPKEVDQAGMCCDYVQIVRRNRAGALSPPETIVADLMPNGQATGRLLPAGDGRTLAVVSSAAGISVAAARGAGRFALARLIEHNVFDLGPVSPILTPVDAIATDSLGDLSAIAYADFAGNRLQLAVTAPGFVPDRARTVAKLGPYETFADYGLAIHGSSIGLAWVQPQNRGSERVEVADIRPTGGAVRPRALGAGSSASVALAGNRRGDEIVAWAACRRRCPLQVEARRGREPLGAPQMLGVVDTNEAPKVALSADGDGLAVWVHRGRVDAAELAPGQRRFGRAHAISGPGSSAPTLVYGPRGEAVAAWLEGPSPRVEAAVFRAG